MAGVNANISFDLLNWFTHAARKMPWRENGNPYFIWISEIMLQQTQVATVTPYFARFTARFPTVKALAEAPLDDVLKLWEGLGYYSRARNLHKGAKYVLSHFEGQLPRDPKLIREIPGIGPYSAGAILSIAYGLSEPAVDGNVIRVFSRLFSIKHAFDKAKPKRELEALVRQHIPDDAPGDFNQAVMELGALVCRPKNPDCQGCPLQRHCGAFAEGTPEIYPIKGKKTKVKAVTLNVAWAVHEELGVLLNKQGKRNIFQEMWCLPASDLEEPLPLDILQKSIPVPTVWQEKLTEISHTLTHRQLTLKVHYFRVQEPFGDLPAGWTWVKPNLPHDYAVPVAYQKVFDFVQAHPLVMLMFASSATDSV